MHPAAVKTDVDLLLINGEIYTVDSAFTIAESMAVKDGKIVATGTSAELQKLYSTDHLVDAGGHAVFPGLIDAHCHFTGYSTDKWKCSVIGTSSFEEVIDSLKNYSTHAPMKWLYGRGWDQNDWAVKEYPDKTLIDSLFPDRPVFPEKNRRACRTGQPKQQLDIAGINEETVVQGGSVEKKERKAYRSFDR